MKYSEIKEGSKWLITGKPNVWSSAAGGINPLDKDFNFPIIVTVERVAKRSDHTAIFDGTYGWSVRSLEECGMIKPYEEEAYEIY